MQLLLFIAIVLLLSAFWYAKKEALSIRTKLLLLGCILMTIVAGAFYEWKVAQKSAHNRVMLNAFKQGKTLVCGQREVHQKDFIFVSGTMSFIPSDTNKNDKGVVIDIFTCKLP